MWTLHLRIVTAHRSHPSLLVPFYFAALQGSFTNEDDPKQTTRGYVLDDNPKVRSQFISIRRLRLGCVSHGLLHRALRCLSLNPSPDLTIGSSFPSRPVASACFLVLQPVLNCH